ncbi:MAG: succinylglutamate desuccinylase/aspartoacylase family protein [Pseudomonadota bacterium]
MRLKSAGGPVALVRRALALPARGQPLPVLTLEHPASGPRVVVCANLHGDECVGIGVVHRLVESLPSSLLRGAVRLYPSLNPAGLRQGCRGLPTGGADLNRSFPGEAHGDPATRTAHALWNDMLGFRPDLVLDLHADSPASIPYAILDRPISPRARERTAAVRRMEELAAASGLTVVRDYAEGAYRTHRLDRSLSGALLNHGDTLAFTLELGPRRMLPRPAVEEGLAAVLGVLTELGLTAVPAAPHASLAPPGPWRRDPGPRTTRTGLLCPLASPGARLLAGEPLVEVREVDGALVERLSVTEPALVLALSEQGWAEAGSTPATLAVLDR